MIRVFLWRGLLAGGLTALVACNFDIKQVPNDSESAAAPLDPGQVPTTPGASPSVPGASTSTASGDMVDPTGIAPSDMMEGTDPGEPLPPVPDSPRVVSSINADWLFNGSNVAGAEQPAFDDTDWAAISLPHTWNNLDGQNGPTTNPAYYRGVGWYRKHYAFPADTLSNKKLYLQFDGSAYLTELWVNGTRIGAHGGGYASFRFDITSAVRLGEDNVIAVKVDNSPSTTGTEAAIQAAATVNIAPRSGDWSFAGGIYRDVYLLATDNLAISPADFGSSGVYLKTTNVSRASADLDVTVKLLNGNAADKTAAVEVTLVDAAGAIVQTLTGTQNVPANAGAELVLRGTVASPHLWNGLADPYVYRANVVVKDGAVVTDAVQQPVGFRFFSFDANNGFFLNGERYPLYGVNMHQDHKDKGPVSSVRDTDEDFAILKELGATAVRFSHYQHSPYTYDKADELGIVVWAENALVNSINDTPEFWANTQQQLTELIRQNYNHPSVVLWSMSNEILIRPSTPTTGANVLGLMTALKELAHAEDPTRPTTQANSNGNQVVNEVQDVLAWNAYNGWYSGFVRDFAGFLDGQHARFPNRPFGISEYGAGSSILQHALPNVETGGNRTGGVQSEEFQAFLHEEQWKMLEARPYMALALVWVLFDFASDYRNEGLVPGLNTKGLVTQDRQTKKDAFYWYKANWAKEPFVHINSRRFTNLPRSANEIRVYSNQPEVELTLNGTSLGSKQADGHIFVWTGINWASGANAVTATATSGVGGTDSVSWTN